MRIRHLLVLLVAAALIVIGGGFAHADKQSEWLKKAQIGPHAPKQQDWGNIEAAAKKEGKVVIYSVSSRIFKLQKKFKKQFGVEIVGHDISSDIQLEKFRREHKARIYQVDVLFNNETPLLMNEFLPRKLVWNFVPNAFADKLTKDEKEPFLVQRWSSRVVFYNAAKYPKRAPVDSLWDLTRKEWRGKVLMPNPLEQSVQANVLQTILQHPKEMAAAYEQEFGKPVSYSKKLLKATKKNPNLGKPDAAKEWLYRFLRNKKAG
jgi:iron(III) transport system substrate-binding protein